MKPVIVDTFEYKEPTVFMVIDVGSLRAMENIAVSLNKPLLKVRGMKRWFVVDNGMIVYRHSEVGKK